MLAGLIGWSPKEVGFFPDSTDERTSRLVPQTGTPDSATEEELAELAASINAFSVDLYQQLRETEDGNIFYSPHSIWVALAMAYAGALDSTESEMASLLHDNMAPDRLHVVVSALARVLESRVRAGEGDSDGIELNIANALWADQSVDFRDDFVRLLADLYESHENQVNFGDPQHAADLINAWASEHTGGHIPEIVRPSSFNSETVFVLTNAIYFAGSWASAFTEAATREAPFTLLGGGEVMVDLMAQTADFRYGAGEGYQVAVLPYEGGELEMVILLPREGHFAQFEADLTAERLAEIMTATYLSELELYLPKFQLDTSYGLNDVLEEMGMVSAFDIGSANFGNIANIAANQVLYIQAVLHKAHLEVDESGTVATAVTAIVGGLHTTSIQIPTPPTVFRADRPFIPIIRDAETGTVLFMGRVVNPAG